MPHKDPEARREYRRKKYAEDKNSGIKRDYGKITAICPSCLKIREISKNQHGITKLTKDDEGRIIKPCRSCSKIKTDGKYKDKGYIRDYQTQKRRELKIKCIEYKGNECKKCKLKYNGTNAYAFDFHHIDPKEKDFYPTARNRNFEIVKKELDKCDLLCAICHREQHSEPY